MTNIEEEPEAHSSNSLLTMTVVSKAHYLEGLSKVEIARRLGISRFMVARALENALQQGVVTISINSGLLAESTSRKIEKHLNVPRVHVVDAYGSIESLRRIVAQEAGTLLAKTLRDGEVLGLGWGRTLSTLLDHVDDFPSVGVVSLSGQFEADVLGDASALNRRVFALTGYKPATISAPFFMEDSALANQVRRTQRISSVTRLFGRISTAIIAVGSIKPDFMSVAYTGVPNRFSEEVINSGAVGEVCGNLFSAEGLTVRARVAEHRLSITTEELKRVPRVIAVVCGDEKAPALSSVCASGMVTDLVIDTSLADKLLSLPKVKPIHRSS